MGTGHANRSSLPYSTIPGFHTSYPARDLHTPPRMGDPKKKIGLLCLLLIVSSGWIALTSHKSAVTAGPKTGGSLKSQVASGTPSQFALAPSPFLSDSNLPAAPSLTLGNNEGSGSPTRQGTPNATNRIGEGLPPAEKSRRGPEPYFALGSPELFLRMMLSVGLVIGLGAVALYLSKRALPRVAKAASKEIHVLETAHLGPRKALHLVEVGGRRLLIASTSDSVTMLAGVPEREAPCLESPPMDDAWPDASKRKGTPNATRRVWEPNSERR